MPVHRADVILVLGTAIEDDGSLSLDARRRVERAAAVFAAGVAPRVIFSGFCGLTANAPACSEASAMADYAERVGIPRAAMLLEERARDTIGNAYFVEREHLAPHGWTSLRVVTSDFHVPRTAWVFEKVLGPSYDVAFSPATTELDGTVIAARARAEGDITTFLMEWIGPIRAGDRDSVERLIWEEHPAYATNPALTTELIRERIEEIARVHRVVETHGLRRNQSRQERQSGL
jgi:uncharacterized SAM-binding protein YcdF (DUF218 family)